MAGPQRIPRPADARAGVGSPPWGGLSVDQRRVGLGVVRRAVTRQGGSPPVPEPLGRMPAAVLLALFEEHDEARVLLTRRARHLRSHHGEVAFPGGRLEPGEEPVAAAVREAAEEVGLDPARVDVVGRLTPLPTLSSGALVSPFVGVLGRRPALTLAPGEVESAFDVSLSELMEEGVYHEERWDLPGWPDRPVHFFDLADDVVWGATARILHELLSLVAVELRSGPG